MIMVNKVDAAVDQLDWAIRLLIDHEAYIPAITLAGACDGILGGMNRQFFDELRDSLASQYQLSSKEVSDIHINKAKNWLKHATVVDSQEFEFDLQSEAIMRITLAIAMLKGFDNSVTSQTPRFAIWLRESNIPDAQLWTDIIIGNI